MKRKENERKRRSDHLILIAVLSGALLLTACGGAGEETAASANGSIVAETAAAAASDMRNFDVEGEWGAGASYMDSGNTDAALLSENEALSPEAENTWNAEDASMSRKLIRTVNLAGETETFDAVLENISERVAGLGGYIETMDRYAPGNRSAAGDRSAYIVARIPADRLDEFLSAAFTNVQITRQSENAQDITLQYTDMDARLRVLRIEQDRLMELLAKAESTDGLIALEQRLSEIRYEIESISSQLRVYDNRVSYSTVDISLTEVKQITATADEGFAAQLRSGFTANMNRMGELLRDAALYILTALPFLFPVAALLVLVYSMIKIAGKLAGKKAETRSKRMHPNETITKAGTRNETLSAGNDSQHADDKAGETELHR